MTDRKHDRFAKAFNAPSVKLVQIHDVIFVMINSMAMEGDGCHICSEAINKLKDIKWKLKCAKVSPICDLNTYKSYKCVLVTTP